MEFTGERFLPQLSGVIELEHVHRYLYSMQFIEGKHVLDIACGEGYGSALLARKAKTVLGVDIDQSSISNATKTYSGLSNLEFSVGSLLSIPIPDESVDLITCFESIEHVTDHDEVMKEFKRILRPEGILLLSTPNKYVYSDLTGYVNPFHPRELYQGEFEELLSLFFLNHMTVGQRVALSSIITGDENGVLPLNWLFKDNEASNSFVEQSRTCAKNARHS
jgi:ubiquinone/menaquinone biosynthesis C-methylase UbiE